MNSQRLSVRGYASRGLTSLLFRPAGLCLLLFLSGGLVPLQAGMEERNRELRERADKLHAETPLIDGHNDLPHQFFRRVDGDLDRMDIAEPQPQLHTDIPRMQEGGVGTQIWAAYVAVSFYHEGTSARRVLQMIDFIHRLTGRYEVFEMAYTADDIERIHREGRIGSMIGIEGGHAIENDLGALRMYYALGARYMGLTHNISLPWVESNVDEAGGAGLSSFGEEVVREMNRLGMLVDLAHVSSTSMRDAIRVSEAPVISSHSCSRELVPHNRNIPDDVLHLMRDNGGLVMVAFAPAFLNTNPREASLSDAADHIEYIRDVAGIDHVGIGSDFDGLRRLPEGLGDVATFKDLTVELLRRDWSDDHIRQLLGGNFLRVLREAETVARRLQRERGSSVMQME